MKLLIATAVLLRWLRTGPSPARLVVPVCLALGLSIVLAGPTASAQETSRAAATKSIFPDLRPTDAVVASPGTSKPAEQPSDLASFVTAGPDVWTSREGLSSSLKIMLLLTVLSLAPALLLMTTSFIRIAVVLGLLRQALGLQQLPPGQVMTSIALFLTVLIMTPVWTDVYNDAVVPYSSSQSTMSLEEAWQAGIRPIHRFMSRQIEMAGNSDDVWLFYKYMPRDTAPPKTYEEVPLRVLMPAFMLSELKTAFLIGFQIFLPFIVLDIVVASVTISMGMMMLPPVMISLPFKLMLFVLVDGWRLVVQMLLDSFAPYT